MRRKIITLHHAMNTSKGSVEVPHQPRSPNVTSPRPLLVYQTPPPHFISLHVTLSAPICLGLTTNRAWYMVGLFHAVPI